MFNVATLITRLRSGGIVSAFRHRDFAIWSLAAFTADNGMWSMRVGISWLTWDLTHDGFWLGAVTMAQALPAIFLVPFAGALADRMDRVKIMRNTQSFAVVLSFGLCIMTLLGLVNEYFLLCYAFVHGSVATISVPSRVTIGPNLVPRADVTAAIGCSSVLFGLATFLGPALAGILIDFVHIGFTFAVNGVTNLVLIIALNFIHIERQEMSARRGSLVGDVVEAVRYVSGHQGILPVLILSIFAALLLRPLQDLLPGFADTVFDEGAHGFARLLTCYGVGGMISGVWLANRNRIEGTGAIFLWSMMASSVVMVLFALTDNYYLGLTAMVVMGMTFQVANNTSQILVQNAVEGSMRARVMSLYSYNYRLVPSLGTLVMGWASTPFGFQAPVVVAGVLGLVAWGWTHRRRIAMRDALESGTYEDSEAAAE